MDGKEINIWNDRCCKLQQGLISLNENQCQNMRRKVKDDFGNGKQELVLVGHLVDYDNPKPTYDSYICEQGMKDRVMGSHSTNGMYFIKDGYHVQKEEKLVSYMNPSTFHFSQSINPIATNMNIWKRNVKDSPTYLLCGKEIETTKHALLVKVSEQYGSGWMLIDKVTIQYKMKMSSSLVHIVSRDGLPAPH